MYLQTKDFVLVGIQILLFFLYYLDPDILRLFFPEFIKTIALITGGAGIIIFLVAILQLNKNLSPFPSPKSDSNLVRSGLYKLVRHPIYSGMLIALGSFSIFSSSGFRVIIAIFLYVLFIIKTNYEEDLLMEKFEEYKVYRKKTGRFFPRI